MLQREYRLPLQHRKSPIRTYRTAAALIKVFPSNGENPQFGFIVSKANARHAVSRNRIKRQIRGIIERHITEFTNEYGILFIVQKAALGLSSKQLEEILIPALKKLLVLS